VLWWQDVLALTSVVKEDGLRGVDREVSVAFRRNAAVRHHASPFINLRTLTAWGIRPDRCTGADQPDVVQERASKGSHEEVVEKRVTLCKLPQMAVLEVICAVVAHHKPLCV
jgi:hypothetical protein